MIVSQRRGHTVVLAIDRRHRRNALTGALVRELTALVTAAQGDPAVAGIVLTGSGAAFCAGQDLSERRRAVDEPPPDLGASLDDNWNPLLRAMRLDKPVVTAVNGVAAGAGASLAFAGDVVLAAPEARFVASFAAVGLMPDCGGTWIFTRTAGRSRAAGAMLLAGSIDAATAADWGLVTAVVDGAVLLDGAVDAVEGGGR